MTDTPSAVDRWGINLAAARRASGLTQDALADELAVEGNTVSRWETGLMRPSWTMQDRIARRLNVSVTSLFPRNDDEATLVAEYDQLLERVGGGCS